MSDSSQPIFFNLNQVLKNLQDKQKTNFESMIPYTLGPIMPILFQRGVTVISHENRKESAQLSSFLAAQMIKATNSKILHVCLEEFIEDTSLNYLSLIANEKIRHLKSPKYQLAKIEEEIKIFSERVNLVPIKNELSVMSQLFNQIQGLISTKDYGMVIFEGIDKVFSKSQRETLFNKFLDLLKVEAQNSDTIIVCATKEDFFKKNSEIKYVLLEGTGKKRTIKLEGSIQTVNKSEDFVEYYPDFEEFSEIPKDSLVIGYDVLKQKWETESVSNFQNLLFLQEESKDQNSDSIEKILQTFYSMNLHYRENSFFIGTQFDKEKMKQVPFAQWLTSRTVIKHLDGLVDELHQRRKYQDSIASLSQEMNSSLKKHFLYLTSRYWEVYQELSENEAQKFRFALKELIKQGPELGIFVIVGQSLGNELQRLREALFGVSQFILPNAGFKQILCKDRSNANPLRCNLLTDSNFEGISLNVLKAIPDNAISLDSFNMVEINPLRNNQDLRVIEISQMDRFVKNKAFLRKFNFGFSEESKELVLVDPVVNPGAIFAGSMGSGKTDALKFTLLSHMLANSKESMYLLFSANGILELDYTPFLSLKNNVAHIQGQSSSIVLLVKMLHEELQERRTKFAAYNVNNIDQYSELEKENSLLIRNKKAGLPSVSRIVVAIENFDVLMRSDILKFSVEVDTVGTTAYQMKELMRLGRSYGITFLLTATSCTADSFPSVLKPGITQLMAFRTNSAGYVTALNLPLVDSIQSNERGRAVTHEGYIQFPLIEDEKIKSLLTSYRDNLETVSLKYSLQDYQEVFSQCK